MSTVKIKSKEYDLKYTFNSFKYMSDFEFSGLEDLDKKPFKIIPIVENLLFGAVNHDPKYIVKLQDVQSYLENYVIDGGNIVSLLEELLASLQESNFFKALQKK